MQSKKLRHSLVASLLGASLTSQAWAVDIVSHHMNLDMDYVGGVLSLDFKTYSPMSPATVPLNSDDYSPTGNRIVVPVANTYTVPAAYPCLGTSGSTVYRLDKNPIASQMYLGWNTVDVGGTGVWSGNKVTLELVSVVNAPAGSHFVLYETDFTGAPIYHLNTLGGACNDQSMDISRNTHKHGYWLFSKSGVYTLRMRVKGTLAASGTVVTSSNVDVVFTVQ